MHTELSAKTARHGREHYYAIKSLLVTMIETEMPTDP